ncbi:MAG TPA: GNAT family protein [Jatrophihabitans sp.]|jgi:RimJ/RimL family protein N-acetyltransferase|nr:GNAT family protein [Jatrophihabitans sp.]
MIQGERVLLRALQPEDYPRLTVFKNDVEFELLGGGDPPRPRTLATVTEFFDELVKDKSSVNFAIEVDGVFIGDCGLFHFDQRAGTAELGIGIGDRDYQGNGYGREAVTLLVDYGFRLLNLRKIWLETLAYNERAIRSYQAVGFVEEGRQRAHVWSDGRYADLVLMALFATDFVATAPAR